MTDKVILLGQAPGDYGRTAGEPVDPRWALHFYPANGAGGRLQRLLGVSRLEYLQRFDRRNLLGFWPGPGGGGDYFPVRTAREVAETLRPALRGRQVLVVGLTTAKALGVPAPVEPLVQGSFDGIRYGVIPHTSGRCRFWNDPSSRAAGAEFARRFCGLTAF